MRRFPSNPLLSPDDLSPTREDLTVFCTLNPGAARLGGEIILLVRVGEQAPQESGWANYLHLDESTGQLAVGRYALDDPDLECPDGRGYYYRGKMVTSSLSHLRVARSTDGENFTFDPQPAIFPQTPYEAFGCEDARITFLDGRFWICYTAVSIRGVCVAMASTEDFRQFRREGVIFPPYQKDVCLFPAKVGGRYFCRHRPYKNEFNDASIWTACSPDLYCWGHHELTLPPRPGTWMGDRTGAGAPPIRTDEGWLEIFHAADETGRYGLGAMLSDLEQPERILSISERPVLEPQADYELQGVFANCVFSNGLVTDEDGRIIVYYGAADRIVAAAETTVEEMLAAARNEV